MRIDGPQVTSSLSLNGTTITDFNVFVSTASFNGLTGSYATTGSNLFKGTQTLSGSILPSVNNTYDLGSPTQQFRHVYISSGSLYVNGTKVLGATSQELQITTDVGQSFKILESGSDTITLQSVDGNVTLTSSGQGDIVLDPTTGIIGLKGTITVYTGNKITSSDGNSIQFGNGIAVTGSIVSTVTSLVSGSSQVLNGSGVWSGSAQLPSGVVSGSSQILNSSGVWSGSAQLPSGIISGSSQLPSGIVSSSLQVTGYGFATTGSNAFIGTQTITGSLYISSDLVVQGSSSLQNITASAVNIGANVVNLNTANPAIRFAGLNIFDSGSIGGSGSFLYDSVQDEFIFVHRGDNANITSSVVMMGPQTYNNIGSETYPTNNLILKGTGNEHLGDSCIFDNGTTTCIKNNLITTGTGLFSGQLCTITGVFGSKGGGNYGVLISDNDQSNVRLRFTNSGTGGQSMSIVGGNPGLSNCGLAFYDETNTCTRMYISSNGNVGIGTTLPGLNLSAQGLYGLPNTSGTQTVGIFRVQDSASNIALDMGVVQNVATWIQSGNKANSEVLPLTLNPSGGNVGIGVTPSVWRSSERALQIGPTTTLYDVFGITILGNNFYTNTSSQSIYSTCGYASYYWQNTSDGSHVWTTAPSAAAGSVISFCERMRITCGGNVGIGTTTPKTYSSLTTQGQLISLNNIGIDYGQSFRLNNYYNSGTGTDKTISSGYAASIGLDQSGGAMVFQMSTTCAAGDNNITTKERIRLTCNGTVLINNSGGYVDYSRVTISGTCNKNQTPGVGGSILHLTSCETDYPFGLKFNIVGDTCNCLRTMQLQTGDHGLTNQGNITFQHAGGGILMGTSTSSGVGILNTYKAPINSNYVDQIVVQGTGNYPSLRLGTYDAYDAVIATTGNDLRILSGLNVYTEDHNIMFYTSFNGGTGGAQCYERMRIRYDGNVGIGTASPSAKLQVAGTIYNSSTAGGGNYTLDTMGAYQSIANGGFVDFHSMSGMILVNNWLNGGVTLYLVGGGNTGALGSVVNVVGTMHHNPGVGGYRWCNNYGSTANFGFQVFRTRNTA